MSKWIWRSKDKIVWLTCYKIYVDNKIVNISIKKGFTNLKTERKHFNSSSKLVFWIKIVNFGIESLGFKISCSWYSTEKFQYSKFAYRFKFSKAAGSVSFALSCPEILRKNHGKSGSILMTLNFTKSYYSFSHLIFGENISGT